MLRLVSKETEKMKAHGMTSLAEVGSLLTFGPYPYYAEMKELARQVRNQHGLTTPRVTRSDLRRIYRAEGIRLDTWPGEFTNLRGAYFNDEWGANVMVMKGLPVDTLVFTIAHELKHHLFDSDLRPYTEWRWREPNPIEVGAEIFAAELIYPEKDFRSDAERMGIRRGECSAKAMLQLKRETRTTLPYKVLADRAVAMGFALRKTFQGEYWRKLEKKSW